MLPQLLILLLFLHAFSPSLRAQESSATVASIAAQARPSVTVITFRGRDGAIRGVSSGFVISPDGLLATSLHVIGEARPVSVEFADGRRFDVTEIHAWDRKLDLAIIRIDATDLPALPLGDSDTLQQGAPVVALGNPHGLDHSVVQGIVSALRDFETGQMIQLAIPVEPGNSGGPVLDLHGRVHGILTMKSAITANLGFATPVNDLKRLMERPSPMPMERWLTIGALDPNQWTTRFGARWTQKSGRILVEGAGQSFGGRSLCLSTQPVPEPPGEISVAVLLDHEAGAAGLVFGSDGQDQHYGFYPSAGKLRLTRFDGPTVFTWTILEEVESRHYQPGNWNTLKVRLEPGRILCYVNDHPVIERIETARTGAAGLAKFRDTKARFKSFQIGRDLPPSQPPPELVAAIQRQIQNLPLSGKPEPDLIEALQPHAQASQAVLAEHAKKLEHEAAQIRKLARAVHQRAVATELLALFQKPEAEIDLFRAALLVARLDNPELDPAHYERQLNQMARDLQRTLPPDADRITKLDAVVQFLFAENGFHGNRTESDQAANHYVNEVLDDREGEPVTLSILMVELSRRIGLDELAILPLPGNYLVQFIPADGPSELLDVFDGGKVISLVEAEALVRANAGRPLRDEHLLPASKREVILALLHDLTGIALRNEPAEGPLRYLDLMLALRPEAPVERWSRAMLRLKAGDQSGAKTDFEWLLEHRPRGIDLDRVLELHRSLTER